MIIHSDLIFHGGEERRNCLILKIVILFLLNVGYTVLLMGIKIFLY